MSSVEGLHPLCSIIRLVSSSDPRNSNHSERTGQQGTPKPVCTGELRNVIPQLTDISSGRETVKLRAAETWISFIEVDHLDHRRNHLAVT